MRVGQPSSGEKPLWDADALEIAEGKNRSARSCERRADPTSSETLCMRVHLLMETWEVFAFSIVSYGGLLSTTLRSCWPIHCFPRDIHKRALQLVRNQTDSQRDE
jgi:hypothetical protein